VTPIEFDATIFQDGSSFVAHCPVLEARQNLKMSVRLFVEEAEKLGTLEDIL
jgi:hypothetical protein